MRPVWSGSKGCGKAQVGVIRRNHQEKPDARGKRKNPKDHMVHARMDPLRIALHLGPFRAANLSDSDSNGSPDLVGAVSQWPESSQVVRSSLAFLLKETYSPYC